jgi:hypothetical protein
MQEREWTKQEKRVLNAFSGGKTVGEAREILKKKPKTRQLRNIMRELMNHDELRDENPDQRGRSPHTYIPKRDSFGPDRPVARSFRLENDDEAITIINEDVRKVLTALVASRRNRTPKRIREICNRSIGPMVSDIMDLMSATKRVHRFDIDLQKLHPGRYFTEEYVPTKRLRSSVERKGTKRVRHPASTDEEDWFYPTIPEWERYFEWVRHETQEIAQGYRLSETMRRSKANGQENLSD